MINPLEVDWVSLKSEDYLGWRNTLWQSIERVLQDDAPIDLANLNPYGLFHKTDYSHEMMAEWEKQKKAPEGWMSKGFFPGIWMTLFNPHNSYSFSMSPANFLKLSFKPGYHLFDPQNPEHRELWESWSGKESLNPWANAVNDQGSSLE